MYHCIIYLYYTFGWSQILCSQLLSLNLPRSLQWWLGNILDGFILLIPDLLTHNHQLLRDAPIPLFIETIHDFLSYIPLPFVL